MNGNALNKVLYDIDQRGDTTASEKKTARDNIGAASSAELSSEVSRATAAEAAAKTVVTAGQNVTVTETVAGDGHSVYEVASSASGTKQFSVVRNPNDSSNTYRYVKVAEIDTNAVSNYIYGYELGIDVNITNGGFDGQTQETGHFDLAVMLRRNINCWYINGAWPTYTQSDYWGRVIESAMVLRQRHVEGNDNVATKYELWLKFSNNFTVMSMATISVTMNGGSSTYAASSYAPTNYDTPWIIPTGCQVLTTTAPTMRTDEGYSYDTETFVPEVASWYRRKHTATLEYHGEYGSDGEEWYITNLKNGAVNHVIVDGQDNVICKLFAVAPTIRSDEEYDYAIVFDCTDSAGNAILDIENAAPRIEKNVALTTNLLYMKTETSVDPSDANPAEARVKDSDGNNRYLRLVQASYPGGVSEYTTVAAPGVLNGASLVLTDVTNQTIDFSGARTYQVRVLGNCWRLETY